MRKKPPSTPRSEEANSQLNMEKRLTEICERLERLEAEVFGTDVLCQSPLPPRPSKKGRKPRIDPKEVLERRDRLTVWLEQNWPFLSVRLSEAEKPVHAAVAMIYAKKRIQGVFQPPFYNEPEKYAEELWQFLQSGRFHENPRNLAGALAGLPEVSWKRSFDICSKHPCRQSRPLEAYRDHIQRNFPDRFRELCAAKTVEEVKTILAKSRTTDPTYAHLKEKPDQALEWLALGDPAPFKRKRPGYLNRGV